MHCPFQVGRYSRAIFPLAQTMFGSSSQKLYGVSYRTVLENRDGLFYHIYNACGRNFL